MQSLLLLCRHRICDVSVTFYIISVTLSPALTKKILNVHPGPIPRNFAESAEAIPNEENQYCGCAPWELSQGTKPSLVSLRCSHDECLDPALSTKCKVKTDTIGWMPKLIWIFTWRTFILFVHVMIAVLTSYLSRDMIFTAMWHFDYCRLCSPPLKLQIMFSYHKYSSDWQKLWSDCAYAKADMRLCWSHILHCWKSRVGAQSWWR